MFSSLDTSVFVCLSKHHPLSRLAIGFTPVVILQSLVFEGPVVNGVVFNVSSRDPDPGPRQRVRNGPLRGDTRSLLEPVCGDVPEQIRAAYTRMQDMRRVLTVTQRTRLYLRDLPVQPKASSTEVGPGATPPEVTVLLSKLEIKKYIYFSFQVSIQPEGRERGKRGCQSERGRGAMT